MSTAPNLESTPTADQMIQDPSVWADYELVDGELVGLPVGQTPHSVVIIELGRKIGNWIDSIGCGSVGGAEQDIRLGPNTLYRVDLFWSPKPASELPNIPDHAFPLMIEVISEGNEAARMEQKISDYLDHGADEVWEVFPQSKKLRVHYPDGTSRLFISSDTYATAMMPGFELNLSDLFKVIA